MFPLGIALLAGAIFFTWRTLPMVRGDHTKGTVVDLDRASGPHGGTKPVVQFRADGHKHRFTGTVSSYPTQYLLEDRVDVVYDADTPEHASINTFEELWLLPAILGPAGLLVLLVGWGLRAFIRSPFSQGDIAFDGNGDGRGISF